MKRKISYAHLETKLSLAIHRAGKLEAAVSELKETIRAQKAVLQGNEDSLKAWRVECEALNSQLKIALATNAAHCVVIEDLQQNALHRHNEWLMKDAQERYSELNRKLVQALYRVEEVEKQRDAHKANAERFANEICALRLARQKEANNGAAETLLAGSQG